MPPRKQQPTPEAQATLDRLARAADELREARAARDELIVRARTLGATREAVAEAAGLSIRRVHQIVND